MALFCIKTNGLFILLKEGAFAVKNIFKKFGLKAVCALCAVVFAVSGLFAGMFLNNFSVFDKKFEVMAEGETHATLVQQFLYKFGDFFSGLPSGSSVISFTFTHTVPSAYDISVNVGAVDGGADLGGTAVYACLVKKDQSNDYDMFICSAADVIYAPDDSSYLFENNLSYTKNIQSINFNGIFKVLSRTVKFAYMFYGCQTLTSLDMSGFDMSGATNTASMLYGCNLLADIYTPSAVSSESISLPAALKYCDAADKTKDYTLITQTDNTSSKHLSSYYVLTVYSDGGAFAATDGWTLKTDGISATKKVLHSENIGSFVNVSIEGYDNTWNENSDGTGKAYTSDSVISGNTSVYAVWTPAHQSFNASGFWQKVVAFFWQAVEFVKAYKFYFIGGGAGAVLIIVLIIVSKRHKKDEY